MSAEDPLTADYALITAALQGFGLTELTEVQLLADGLMNRNWRVGTREGVWALKQVLDVHADQARRQHRVTRALGGLGLPVPPPQTTPDGDTLVDVNGVGVFAMSPWVDGVHRDGRDLTLGECRHLGDLLARIHSGLGGDESARVLARAPESQVVAVSEAAKTKAFPRPQPALVGHAAQPAHRGPGFGTGCASGHWPLRWSGRPLWSSATTSRLSCGRWTWSG